MPVKVQGTVLKVQAASFEDTERKCWMLSHQKNRVKHILLLQILRTEHICWFLVLQC